MLNYRRINIRDLTVPTRANVTEIASLSVGPVGHGNWRTSAKNHCTTMRSISQASSDIPIDSHQKQMHESEKASVHQIDHYGALYLDIPVKLFGGRFPEIGVYRWESLTSP